MKLTEIISLYRQMKDSSKSRQQFDFTYNGVHANVFFLIDVTPFLLMFGIKNTNQYFELEAKAGFNVDTYFAGELFHRITKMFGITYKSNYTFKPIDFLNFFNSKIPQDIKETKEVKPSSLAPYCRNVEEVDKIYFIGFLDNNKQGHKCTAANLDKTLKLMGYDAYKRCKEQNLSTRWTDNPDQDQYENREKLYHDTIYPR